MKKLVGFTTFVVLIGVIDCSENASISNPTGLTSPALEKSYVPPGSYQGTFAVNRLLDLPLDGIYFQVAGQINYTYRAMKGGNIEFSPEWSLKVEEANLKTGQVWEVADRSILSGSLQTRIVEQEIRQDDKFTMRVVFSVSGYSAEIVNILITNDPQE